MLVIHQLLYTAHSAQISVNQAVQYSWGLQEDISMVLSIMILKSGHSRDQNGIHTYDMSQLCQVQPITIVLTWGVCT